MTENLECCIVSVPMIEASTKRLQMVPFGPKSVKESLEKSGKLGGTVLRPFGATAGKPSELAKLRRTPIL